MPRVGLSRLGIHDRITIAFGLIALALSVGLSLATWAWVSHYLLQRQETSDLVEITDNSAALQHRLHAGQPEIATLLDAIPLNDQTASMLVYDGEWYSTSLATGPAAVPAGLVTMVRDGRSGEERTTLNGSPVLVVGLPFQERGDAYFEIFPLDDLDRTFHALSLTLVAAGGATAILGLVLGRVASKRALRPLTQFTDAARAVARGDLTARVPESRDRDLSALADSFNGTADALQRRVVADARFAADVSHELRTPVTTMVNSMQLIAAHTDALPGPVREPVDLLATDLERFRRLVLDLLEISREDGSDVAGSREPVRICELVSRAADRAAGDRTVTCADASVQDLTVDVDKRRLERVVTNLVENAQRHGGGCSEVRVERIGADVRITVDDAGPGVPADQRDRVFDRFARVRADDGEGAGLGLAIVARHVEWHGGSVRAEERPGGGARFVVDLPVVVSVHD